MAECLSKPPGLNDGPRDECISTYMTRQRRAKVDALQIAEGLSSRSEVVRRILGNCISDVDDHLPVDTDLLDTDAEREEHIQVYVTAEFEERLSEVVESREEIPSTSSLARRLLVSYIESIDQARIDAILALTDDGDDESHSDG